MYKKGQSGNPNGRPKGARGKATNTIKSAIEDIVNDNIETLKSDISKLSSRDRVTAITALCSYVIPKLQAVSVEQSIDYEYKRMEELLKNAPDEAIDMICDRIEYLKTAIAETGG